jgi:hypothetical protein
VANPEHTVPSAIASYLLARNNIAITRRWFGSGWALLRSAATLGTTAWFALRPAARPQLFGASARLRGIADAWRGRMGPPPEGLA